MRRRGIARVRTIAGPLSRQFALTVAIVVAPVLIALVVVESLMVVSSHAALLVAGIVIAAGVGAVICARLVARSVLHDVEAIRDGLVAVGQGERSASIGTAVDDELGELAREANAMIDRLAAEEAARDQSDCARRETRRRRLARPANADHLAAAARRGGRRRGRRRRDPPRLPAANAGSHRGAQRVDR